MSPWKQAWDLKGSKLIKSYANSSALLDSNARCVPPLQVGERCLIQNQFGTKSLKWDRSGVVIDVLPFDQYAVRIDGTNHVTNRNRKFLRSVNKSVGVPHHPDITSSQWRNDTSYGSPSPNVQSTYDDHCRPIHVSPSLSGQPVKSPPQLDDPSPLDHQDGTTQQPLDDSSTSLQLPDDPQWLPHTTVPRELHNLRPINEPGLMEETSAPATRLRPRQ